MFKVNNKDIRYFTPCSTVSIFNIKHVNVSYLSFLKFLVIINQPALTCSKLTIKTLEQNVKYVQS